MNTFRFAVCVFVFLNGMACSALAQPSRPPADVVVKEIVQRELAAGQTFVGAVIPSRKSIVGSAVDGRVMALLVNDGDPIGMLEPDDTGRRVGAPIAQLLTDTISIQIAAAQATLELQRQELAELLAGSRPEEIAQARARQEAAQALRKYSRSRLGRVKMLLEENTLSQEDYDQALSVFQSAKQNVFETEAALQLAEEGSRKETIAQAQARVAVAQEDVRRLEDQKKKHTIRAPFEGYIISKRTEVGEWVSQGDPIAEVIALDPVEIVVSVSEDYITHVQAGATVSVGIDALPARVMEGKVARIIPQADLRSRSFPVKIRLPNPPAEEGHLLKAGMLARVTLAVGPLQQALMVPKDALVFGESRPMVMVVQTNSQTGERTVRGIPVQVGVADESLIQVLGDLQPGWQVVVLGNERIFSGQSVRVAPAAAARAPVPRKEKHANARSPAKPRSAEN